MRESLMYGSVRGARGNSRPYRDEGARQKQVRRDLLADSHLLNAANIAHLPVAFWAFGMSVVASDASRAHYDWRDQADAVGENCPGCVGDCLVWVSAQICQRVPFKIVEDVERSVHKWIIRNEAISDVVLLLADDATELKRKRRWDRDRARDGLVIVRHLS
jgi:hypothetical protein